MKPQIGDRVEVTVHVTGWGKRARGQGRKLAQRRRDGFKQLYDWLDGADALAVRADRRPWLVVMPLDRLLALIRDREIA